MKRGNRLQRRTSMKRSGPPNRKPMKPGQPPRPKRARADRDLPQEFWEECRVALYARAGGACELDGCSLDHNGLHAHHRKLRSRGVDHALSNLAALAPSCHRWVHEHPAEATERGFMVASTADPAATPQLLHGGRWVHLTAAGGYVSTEENA